MRLGQSSLVFFLSKIIASVTGFFATAYFTRLLGNTVYGHFAITLSLVAWFSLIKDIGFGQAIIKRMSEGEEPGAYLTAGTIIQGALVIPVIIGILILQPQINEYVGRTVAEFIILLLTVSILNGIVSSSLSGTHRVHTSAVLETVSDLVQNACMVTLVFFGWQLTGMLSGYILGAFISSLIGFYIVRLHPERPYRRHIFQLWEYARFSWLGSVQSKTFHRTDILILGLFVSAGLTGIYAITYTLATFLEIFGNAINNVLFPEMSKLSAQNETEKIGSLTNDALTFAGLFLIPGAVGAAVLGDRILRVYGNGFEQGHWILVILIMALLIYTYTKQLLNTLNAIDRPDLAFRANGLFIGANIALNLILVWGFGWYGAAVATSVSAAIGFGTAYYYLRQLVPLNIPVVEILRQVVAAGIMGIVVLMALTVGKTGLSWVDEYGLIFTLLLVILGAAIYFVVLAFMSTRLRVALRDNIITTFDTIG